MAFDKSGEWVHGPLATESSGGLGPRQLARLARRGEISVRRVPGTWPRYLRSELEALAANSVRPSRHALAAAAR